MSIDDFLKNNHEVLWGKFLRRLDNMGYSYIDILNLALSKEQVFYDMFYTFVEDSYNKKNINRSQYKAIHHIWSCIECKLGDYFIKKRKK